MHGDGFDEFALILCVILVILLLILYSIVAYMFSAYVKERCTRIRNTPPASGDASEIELKTVEYLAPSLEEKFDKSL